MKKLLLLGALAFAGLTSNAETVEVDLDRTNWTINVCSWVDEGNGSGAPEKMFDDNLNTYYHQNWSSDKSTDAYHWFIIDFQQEEQVDGFKYWRRQGIMNGQFISGRVYVSNTGFEKFGTHAGDVNDAKTYYETNDPAGEFNFTYDKNADDMRKCDFNESVKGRYMLVIVSDAGTNNNGRHLCCAEFKVFANKDEDEVDFESLWKSGLNDIVTRAEYFKALGSAIGKEMPSADMTEDVTKDNFYDKLSDAKAKLQEYIDSFDKQLVYINCGIRRGNGYLTALPTGTGVRFNTVADPTADAVWQIRLRNGELGFSLYNRTTGMWMGSGNQPSATATASQAVTLTSRVNVEGYVALANGTSTNILNVDNSNSNLVWYNVSKDDGSQWNITPITVDDQVYVDPVESTAEAPKYYRIVNARWMLNGQSSNIAVNGENQDGNGNGETVTCAVATIPGIYWRVENNGEGVKLINLTGYELTNLTTGQNITMSDKGSTVYLIKQEDGQFNGVNTYAISITKPQGDASCLDVSGSYSKFCWSPSRENNGNGNNGSAWYFIAATDAEIANATAAYIDGVKNRMLFHDSSLGVLFGQEFYENDVYKTYDGEETISALNAAKFSGNYPKTQETIAAVNDLVNNEVNKLVDRHYLLHNCNSTYSNCYMTVTDGKTAPTANAADVNALWSFVPQEGGYLMVSEATGQSLSYTTATSQPIPVDKDGLPYTIKYNANIRGFYFTLVPTDDIKDVNYYSVHQSNNSLVCKWAAQDIAGSHWKIELAETADIQVEKDDAGHSIKLPDGVELNKDASAKGCVMTVTKIADAEGEPVALSVAPADGMYTITADDFDDNRVELSDLEAGTYQVEASAGMFLVNGRPSAAVKNTFDVTADDTTTGVTEVGNVSDVNTVYDLQGRRVKGNAKGLLIVNGKKTLVK